VVHVSSLELVCGIPTVMVYTATIATALFLRTVEEGIDVNLGKASEDLHFAPYATFSCVFSFIMT